MVSLIKFNFKNFISVLTTEQTHILNSALLAMFPVLLTKITGQLFYLLAASYFGTDDVNLQNFLLASAIPDFIGNILIAGVLGGVIIPTLVTVNSRYGYTKFIEIFSSITNFVILLMLFVSLVLLVLPESFFLSLYPDLSVSQSHEIVFLMKLLLVPQVILAISVSISNALNVYHRYLLPQLAPLLFNAGKIIFLVAFFYIDDVLVNSGNNSISKYAAYAIVFGIYFGSLLHLLIQVPLALKLKIKLLPVLHLKDKYIKEIFIVSLPRLFALGSEHLALTVSKFISFGINGGIAALNFANSLSLVIPQVFAYTFSYSSFTQLSENFEKKDYAKVIDIVVKVVNQMLFLSLPFIVGFIVLRVPIVRLSYGLLPNTKLSFEGTYQIAWVLLLFSIGHVFVILKWFLQKVFYAGKNSFIPFVTSVISLISTIFLSVVLTNLFSHNTFYSISSISWQFENFFIRGDHGAAVGGIALAMSIAYTIESILLIVILPRKILKFNITIVLKSVYKKLVAAFGMFVVLYAVYKTWHVVSDFSISNYSRGSQLLNFIVIMPVILMIIYLSIRYLLNRIKIFTHKYLKRYAVLICFLPIIIYLTKFNTYNESFGYLYGIFAMSVAYCAYLFVVSLVFKMFRSVYNFTHKNLTKSQKHVFILFLVGIFSYISINVMFISTSLIDLNLINNVLTSTSINLFFITLVSFLTAFMVYLLMCLLMRVEELITFKKYLNPLLKLGGLSI